MQGPCLGRVTGAPPYPHATAAGQQDKGCWTHLCCPSSANAFLAAALREASCSKSRARKSTTLVLLACKQHGARELVALSLVLKSRAK